MKNIVFVAGNFPLLSTAIWFFFFVPKLRFELLKKKCGTSYVNMDSTKTPDIKFFPFSFSFPLN